MAPPCDLDAAADEIAALLIERLGPDAAESFTRRARHAGGRPPVPGPLTCRGCGGQAGRAPEPWCPAPYRAGHGAPAPEGPRHAR